MTLPRRMVVTGQAKMSWPFPRRVVGLVQVERANRAAPRWIEDGDISIAADRDCAFASDKVP